MEGITADPLARPLRVWAELFGICPETLRREAKRGALKLTVAGRRRQLITTQEMRRYLAANELSRASGAGES